MSIDHLLDRIWTPKYTCNEFLCEAWQSITGENLTDRLQLFLSGSGDFQRIDEPISPCIVFFTNGPRSSTHVGLFYCDKLLHLSTRGVQFLPLELISINFRETRFYL
ncbi:hypothetical protein [Acinetobacter soli]|uniref:hypothetical protein n=1 Tax=Acinetobacter soli TaxID=487316 RepID=UPI001D0AF9B3|nr:hypothetical protein [Acinetobacter soli]MCB8769351.1 hypothetical protein [Acinetobacter soli]